MPDFYLSVIIFASKSHFGDLQMLDIKYIIENLDATKLAMSNRNTIVDLDSVVKCYNDLRIALKQVEELKAFVNKSSSEFAKLKKIGKDTSNLQIEISQHKEKIKILDGQVSELETDLKTKLAYIPNIVHESVPIGKTEADNVEILKHGQVPKFDFDIKPHWEIGLNLDILDQERAASITGSRFCVYKGLGAKLERSLINFMLDTHSANGYTEIFAPFMVNSDSMMGTGQLPKFEEDMYRVVDTNYYLIPTAEVSVTNLHKQEIVASLPLNYCAYSACFRKEGGSAGRDTRGLIRQHQFNKIELVKIVKPQDSMQQLEKLCNDAQKILQLLELPYRVVALCSGDLGFSSCKTYDIEVWMPSYDRFVEISSCSNFVDFQARRANIRFREENKVHFAHTLNGSGLAVGRTVAAILENFQNADGSVFVPKVLQKYLGVDCIRNRD